MMMNNETEKKDDFAKEQLKENAYRLLNEAEVAMHGYAIMCDVGDERTRAFDVYEKIRTADRI